ncbi:uncharacterized protein [Elaeis guineensis]|uniref:uncharacterized protein isoform X1 n=1 Tax=Elaeis guineensis var. tenera TaxID=51953 RepID=UPI003C6D2467
MRFGSGRAMLTSTEGSVGARKWAASGAYGGNGGKGKATQGDVMGSLHQYQIDGREVGTDGGYRQEGQQDSSRLLMLPTILTIGLVAAIPLLVNASSPATVIVVSNAIMNSEFLSGTQQRIMVEKLMQKLQ